MTGLLVEVSKSPARARSGTTAGAARRAGHDPQPSAPGARANENAKGIDVSKSRMDGVAAAGSVMVDELLCLTWS
jgi:hypothetical protein